MQFRLSDLFVTLLWIWFGFAIGMMAFITGDLIHATEAVFFASAAKILFVTFSLCAACIGSLIGERLTQHTNP